jgi:hypothetical protein
MVLELLGLFLIILVAVIFIIQIEPSENTASAIEKGFGFYSQPTEGVCHYNEGQQYGNKTIIQVCNPHPKNGNGCLDDKGSITFNSKISVVPCLVSMRAKSWVKTISPCISSETVCVSNSSQGTRIREKVCHNKSNKGINDCIYVCGTYNDKFPACKGKAGKSILFNTFPFGIELTSPVILETGYKISPQNVDGTWPVEPAWKGLTNLTTEELHVLDSTISVVETCSDHGVSICGQLVALDEYHQTTAPCVPGFDATGAFCYKAQDQMTSEGLWNPFYLFEKGYATHPTKCISSDGKDTICLTPETIDSLDGGGLSGKILKTEQKLSCVKECYLRIDNSFLDIHYWNPTLGNLVKSFLIIRSDHFFLTFYNIPCSLSECDLLLSTGTLKPTLLKDTLSNPFRGLNDTECLMYSSTNEEIVQDSSFYIQIKPYPGQNPDQLSCNLYVLFGDYTGWLTIDSKNQLIWSSYIDLTKPIFTIKNIGNTFSLSTVRGMVTTNQYRNKIFTFDNFTVDLFEISLEKEIINFVKNYNRGRRDGKNKNLFLSYIPHLS